MQESDAQAFGTAARGLVDETDAGFLGFFKMTFKVFHGESDVVHATTTVVLLDEHGKEYRSIEFARWLEQKRNTARRLVFVIGGPYGFSKDVYARANEQVSLSKMTFSHQMIRLTFTEQIYRACTIIKGEPYHHE